MFFEEREFFIDIEILKKKININFLKDFKTKVIKLCNLQKHKNTLLQNNYYTN